jgi:DNA-binding NarL/FixJ family response regulator
VIVSRARDSFVPPALPGDAPRTVIIDRQPLVLAALCSLLSGPPLNADVRTLTRPEAVPEVLSQFPADLVLCEVRAMPTAGPELVSVLSERTPPAKVILLADIEDDDMLLAALHSGARGFFTKEGPLDEFLEGVQAVLAGHFVVGRSLAQRLLTTIMRQGAPGWPRPLNSLSASERAILVMVGRAQSIANIATARGVSRKTVRNHLSSIYRKLGVSNRTEAVLCAARLGLVNADAPGDSGGPMSGRITRRGGTAVPVRPDFPISNGVLSGHASEHDC